MTICVLEGDLRKPYWESQLDNRSVASCRSLWALLELQVSRWIPRSSAKRMVLIMKGVVETTSLIVSIKSVPLRGDPWGMPLSWEWMDTLNDRSSKKLWIRRGRGPVSPVVCNVSQIWYFHTLGKAFSRSKNTE